MGNPKQKWTSEEEEALRAGVAKHGAGKWKNIQRDPEFNHLLYSRSNIDLKDKWRNLNVNINGQGPRNIYRAPKVKASPDVAPAPLLITQAPAPSTPAPQDAPADIIMEDSSKCVLDGKTVSKYNSMIYNALSSLKEPNGSDTSTIVNFIEQRQEVPPNFRRQLTSRLRKLVQQEKLEKIDNCYRIKKEFLEKTKTATPKQKQVEPGQPPNSAYLGDTVEEAVDAATYKVIEADNKSYVAAEAVREYERVSKMADDQEMVQQLANDIFDKCSHGEIVIMA